jgi:hypothetical protein
MVDWSDVISTILGVAGLGYALYQGSERKKLQDFVRGQSWHLFAKANNANGTAQHALLKYKEKTAAGFDPEVLELLAKSDAFGQDVFKDVIRQIQVSEPVFDQNTIQTWVAEGRVNETHAAIFKNLAPSKTK